MSQSYNVLLLSWILFFKVMYVVDTYICIYNIYIMYIYVYMYIYMYMCICICVYLYIYICVYI